MSEILKAPREMQDVRIAPSVEWSEEAKAAQKKALENPNCADAWMNLGLELRKQMLFREAIEAYSRGLACQPFHSMLYRHRGHALVNIGCYAMGASDFEMCLRIDPDNWSAWYHLGLSYHLMGEYALASEAYAQCLKRSYDDYHKICCTDWYCMTLMKMGKIEQMREIASRITKDMVPGEAYGYFGRDLVYNGTNDPEQTLEQARKDNDHMFATGAYGIAVYYEYVLGNEKRAMEILHEIQQRNTVWSGFAEQAMELRLQGKAK